MSHIDKKKNNINPKVVMIISIIVIIIIICIIVKLFYSKEETEISSETTNMTNSEETEEISEEDEIKQLSESNRMKRYIGIFFEDIENGNYQDAYDVLNSDFKDTYFPTLDAFIDYADTYFASGLIGVTYDNIERLGNDKTGNMYVLWLTIDDIFALKNDEETEEDEEDEEDEEEEENQTNFVIIENDYSDYEMSFSVNSAE